MYAEKGQKGFKKGNPGKIEGTVNKNSRLIKDVFVDAFNALQESKEHNLAAWADKNPNDFYKLAMRIIPTQIQLNANVNITEDKVIFE